MNGETIVRTYSDMVYGVAMRYVKNPTDADDVYADVFYRYFRRERTFESEEHRKAWLLRVTINSAKDFLIKRKFDVSKDDDLFDESLMSVTFSGTDISQEEILDVRNALKKLKEERREVIELYYFNGLNTKQIADMLQKPENTIKSELLRGRKELKEYLSK
ncbi:RNA polymerase sigma factor [Pseudobutyrivibrio sp.]|uniref:RNA polymerase sigma factor n=1 Tax=Pseudobutyrivibrio sp. TaxID=2014367 RepID=UPI001DE2978F|nr:sigma-70 family RNA polymerase sigma factor [Pseudobutyrivibrio sp.]MBE5910449.1 sigma-70 family RNA polymerase sigma factor [Pseudobutyrivibrio sp.]